MQVGKSPRIITEIPAAFCTTLTQLNQSNQLMTRIFKYSALTLLLLLSVGLGLALLAPAVLVQPVLTYYLKHAGFEMDEFSGLSVTHERAIIARMTVRNSSVRLSAAATELTYSLPELLGGSLRGIAIAQVELELLPDDTNGIPVEVAEAPADTALLSEQISSALQMLDTLPLANLRIDAIDVRSADTSVAVALEVDTQPLRMAGTIASSQYEGIQLQVSIGSEAGSVIGELDVLQNMQTVMQTTFTANFIEDSLQLQSNAVIMLAPAQTLVSVNSPLAAFATRTETASLSLQLTATDLTVTPALSSVTLTLDNPEHLLQLSYQTGQLESELQLQLPLQWVGAMPALDQVLQLHSAALAATFAVTGSATNGSALTGTALTGPALTEDALAASGSLALQNIALGCSLALECAIDTSLSLQLPRLQAGSIKAPNLSLSTNLGIVLSPAGTTLTMPQALLQLPSLLIANSDISTAITINDLLANISADSATTASLSLSTQSLNLDLAAIELRNPSVAGNISYGNDTLSAAFNLALANQLQAVVTGDWQLPTQTGRLDLDIPRYYFSNITPLSALIRLPAIEADIVAGSIAAASNLTLAVDPDGNWQINGPLNLQVSELGGFVRESFFVGLDSAIQTTVSGTGIIRSQGLLTGKIATVDVGLPLTDLQWNYGFDTGAQTIGVSNLALQTLGGSISIADFEYNWLNPDSQLTVVLSKLNLQSMVDLAQYPGIRVEGLISGYLPLHIKGQTLTITEGLVGALQPGGTIRYGSGSLVSSGNATLDLVNEALANYHYQLMNTRVYYNEAGDLRLEVQLNGNNPDLYNGQLVNLNVNIDDNIPTLLRSLQASRTITDALQQRLQNRQPDANLPNN